MADELKPALTADEWTAIAEKRELLQPSTVDDLCILDNDDLPRAIAYANAKLPEGSPYKITRSMVDALDTFAAQGVPYNEDRSYSKDEIAEYEQAAAAIRALKALLPPEK